MMSILALALAQLALLQATGQDVATTNSATLLRGSRRLDSLYTTADYKRIICPFLSTLVNEGVMEAKTSYHRDELRDIAIDAGIDPVTTEAHIWANFKDIPSGEIDIFDMEGLPNEHHTSTGINDCNTFVHNCKTHDAGHRECSTETQNKMCGVPSQAHFDSFFQIADVNHDNVLTSAELANADGKVWVNDFNEINSGSISGSFQGIIDLWGDLPQAISKEALRTVSLDRRFPPNHSHPGSIVWTVAPKDCQTCDEVCAGHGQVCEVSHLLPIQSESEVRRIAAKAGFTCTQYYKETWASTEWDGPLLRWGTGLCVYNGNPNWKASCSRRPACGYGHRLCPCKR